MSIPLVQNNEKDSINTSIIAIKRQIERINAHLGLSNSEEIDTSVFATKTELEDAVTQVETDLAPVDEVTADNMHSVTSNAVFNFIKIKDFRVYFRDLTWSAGSLGGYWANISINNHITNFNKIISVMSKNWSGVDCRGLFIGLDNNASEITIVVETKGNESIAYIDFRVLYI